MALSSIIGAGQGISGGGGPSKQQKEPATEYEAQAASPIVNGEVKLTIGEDSFTVAALFDMVEIPYAEVNAIQLEDYTVLVATGGGNYTFSRMGRWAQPFYDALRVAYNKAVLRSLFVEGDPILTAGGVYRYTENGKSASGSAPIHVYENCVVVLPPDLKARRIPLCFVSGMDKAEYSLTLTLDTGESYTLSKLGYDTAPFADAVEKQIRKLREKTLSALKGLDPSLTATQASQLVRLMPEGAAAPIGKLGAIAPSFVAALEEKLFATRAAESYKAFKELCAPGQIHIGFRKNETGTDSEAGGLTGAMGGMPGGLAGGRNPLESFGALVGENASQEGEEADAAPPDPYLLWLVVLSPDGRYAAVEFAEANSATFVYRTAGDLYGFAKQLNRALEAISFKREVIRLTDAELLKPENADYLMATDRTAALQFIRMNFAGRAIHSSVEAWKRKLTELWSGAPLAQTQAAPSKAVPGQACGKFCGQCGAELIASVKFCGICGAKQ